MGLCTHYDVHSYIGGIVKINKTGAILLGGVGVLGLVAAGAATGVFRSTEPITLPAGTAISVRLDGGLASDTNSSGDSFGATISSAVMFDGREVVAAGTPARGHIVEARESGRLRTPAVLTLALDEVQVDGSWYDIDTAIAGRRGKSHKKRNWLFIGGGAAGGAVIGALAGGPKGAAIGAGVGAGAGTAAAAITGKDEIRFPAESQITFRLTDSVTVEIPVDPEKKDE